MTSILLVEDHPIFAQALLRFLHEKGHLDVVGVAHSAEEALDQMLDLAVDLVLVDVSLPKRSGISLVFLLHEQYPALRDAFWAFIFPLCPPLPGCRGARLPA